VVRVAVQPTAVIRVEQHIYATHTGFILITEMGGGVCSNFSVFFVVSRFRGFTSIVGHAVVIYFEGCDVLFWFIKNSLFFLMCTVVYRR
jgi:hypothetical protein